MQKEENISAPCELIGPSLMEKIVNLYFQVNMLNIHYVCLHSGCSALLAPKDFIGHSKAWMSIANIIFRLI